MLGECYYTHQLGEYYHRLRNKILIFSIKEEILIQTDFKPKICYLQQVKSLRQSDANCLLLICKMVGRNLCHILLLKVMLFEEARFPQFSSPGIFNIIFKLVVLFDLVHY